MKVKNKAKTLPLIVFIIGCLSTSCSNNTVSLPIGDDPSWISHDRAYALSQDFLRRHGYTNAIVTGEVDNREYCIFNFSTNGVNVPLKVEVDRRTQKIGFEQPTTR
jgi:hypothetical protein